MIDFRRSYCDMHWSRISGIHHGEPFEYIFEMLIDNEPEQIFHSLTDVVKNATFYFWLKTTDKIDTAAIYGHIDTK